MGNSPALRLPMSALKEAELSLDQKVNLVVIPIRIKNDNCVASPCRAVALSAASRLVLLSNANWNYTRAHRHRAIGQD